MSNPEKRTWEHAFQCSVDHSGCGEIYESESSAERCCEGYIYELSLCSWCHCHADFCECEVPEELEG